MGRDPLTELNNSRINKNTILHRNAIHTNKI